MDWQAQIFAYCERGASGAFWAEPLNAISNAAFILAALLALSLWVRQARQERGAVELALIALVFVIGVGSFLFHTYATRWASLADTLPITVFMLVYLVYALVRFVGLGIFAGLLWLFVFMASLWGAESIRCDGGSCLNGSTGYLPALLAVGLIGAVLVGRGHPAGRGVLLGAGVFLVSLVFRTVDRSICPLTLVSGRPIGTHFLWHMLNATLLYILMRAAIEHGRAGTASAKLGSAQQG